MEMEPLGLRQAAPTWLFSSFRLSIALTWKSGLRGGPSFTFVSDMERHRPETNVSPLLRAIDFA